MSNEPLTFNDFPQVVAELRDEVSGMKALLLNLQNRPTQQRENRHSNYQLIVIFAKEAGDLNNDGKMDITDVVSLVNLILGQ